MPAIRDNSDASEGTLRVMPWLAASSFYHAVIASAVALLLFVVSIELAGWALAVSVSAAEARPSATSPEALLQQAREAGSHGDPGRAADIIEAGLTRLGRQISEPDAAILHLEAARLIGVTDPDRAETHLFQVTRLSEVYRPVPALQARLFWDEARVYVRIGDLAQAEPLLIAAAARLARLDPGSAADASNELGMVQLELMRLVDAEGAFLTSLRLLKQIRARVTRSIPVLVNLSMAQLDLGKLREAAATYQRAKSAVAADAARGREVALVKAQLLLHEADLKGAAEVLDAIANGAGDNDPIRGHALYLLATSRFNRGLAPEAAKAALAAAAVYRAALGPADPALGRAYHLLGNIYEDFGDRNRADDFFEAAESIEQRAFGTRSVQYRTTEIERGWLDLQGGRIDEADRRARTALDALERTPTEARRQEGLAHILLALAAEAKGQPSTAIDNYLAGQRLIEVSNGARSPDLTFSLVKLGRLFTRLRRYAEADEKLSRAIKLLDSLGSSKTIRLADALTARADLAASRGDRNAEMEDAGRAYALLKRQVRHDTNGPNTSFGQSQGQSSKELFGIHALRLVSTRSNNPELLEEAFTASQYSLISRTGEALRRATLRLSLGENELAQRIRERENVADQLRQANALLTAILSRSDETMAGEESRLRKLVADSTERLTKLDDELAARFPKYGEFAHPRPISLRAVQTALAADEVLLMTVLTADRLLLWAVDRETAEPVEVRTDARQISQLVDRLRLSIDKALQRHAPDALPAFDVDAARDLYDIVIAPVARLFEKKRHIVFFPEGPLQSIPLHILVGGNKEDWLIRQYAVTTEPSLSGFVAAREAKQHSHAPLAFLGVAATSFAGFGTVADSGSLQYLQSLPAAGSELQQMGALFPADSVRLLVDRDATRTSFLAASAGRYRIVAFATHALTVEETLGLSEPAIVLFPDGKSVTDSLLTSSDIAALNLDADLIVLSACNTAAPEAGPDPEALSGLARAFILAGARALLVSHWSVPDKTAPLLTTKFLAALRKEPALRKSEALRSAILEILASDDPQLRHPTYWAPFVVVAE